MADDVWKNHFRVICANEDFPRSVTKAIFLAGPTPRQKQAASWRPDALRHLAALGFDGAVFSPEPRDGKWGDYTGQVEWEAAGLQRADCILFWLPRDVLGGKFFDEPMPGFTSNDEWGTWKKSGKVVLGYPPTADHISYQAHYAKKYGVPTAATLGDTVQNAIEMVGTGALRVGGECQVPFHIWKRPDFQEWYSAQKAAGNRLDNCRVEWSFRVPPVPFDGTPQEVPGRVFLYALHLDVHVATENRNKTNEIAIFRPGVSSVVLWYNDEDSGLLSDVIHSTEVVLVKEFRTPCRNSECFVYELPGGSSQKPNEDPSVVAAHEVLEETGLSIDSDRLVAHHTRQVGATLSTYTSRLFSVELTSEEVERLRKDKVVHGVAEDTERTYVEVKTVKRILQEGLVDWATLGMIFTVVSASFRVP